MKISLLLSVLCLAVFAVSVKAQPINVNTVPSIEVKGKAEVKASPDMAIFSLVVEKVDMDLKKAKAENDKSVSQVLAVVKKYNISQENVKTDYISVSKKYEAIRRNGTSESKFIGYEVSKTVIIKLTDLSKFEAMFSDLLTTGISRTNRVQFQTSEIRKYKDEARLLAVKAAKEKAVAVAGGLGQTIGKAIKIEIEPQKNYGLNSNISNNFSVGEISTSSASNTFAPGMIAITAEVEVRFLLN